MGIIFFIVVRIYLKGNIFFLVFDLDFVYTIWRVVNFVIFDLEMFDYIEVIVKGTTYDGV